jgi:glycosyltransferase involved in cell wall biosynthesis
MPKKILSRSAQKRIATQLAAREQARTATPLLSLCVIFRDNADVINNLIQSVRGHFDEYVFVDTGSTDGTREIIEGAGLPRLVVKEFEWCDDFSAARQASFDAASGLWRMFLDTDDKLVGGEGLRRLVANLNEVHPQVKGLFIPYVYAADETLNTMRLAKFDSQWRWVDKIHERLERPGLGRDNFGTVGAKDVRVLHKDKTPEEKQAAIERNGVIAVREYATATDPKYRARLARTIAMVSKGQGKNEEAIPFLKELYGEYATFPEGRQAAADLSSIYVGKAFTEREDPAGPPIAAHLDEAMLWAKRAGPGYEAIVHHAKQEWQACLKAAQRSQPLEQQTTHEGWVLEKGGVPAVAAEAVLALGKPGAADVADSILSRIPAKLRLHKLIVPHVMRVRSKIDRITILVPNTPQPFDENGGGGMLGGSEEAVMYLSRALAREGRNVRIFTPLPLHRRPGPDQYGVDWQDIKSFDPQDECGILVVWRACGIILDLMQAAAKQGGPFPGIIGSFLWLHDGLIGIDPKAAEAVTNVVDGTVVLSEFHGRQIAAQGLGNLIGLSNGITREDFEGDIGKWEKDPMSVVYSSCPSRGLRKLLAIWPEVKRRVPAAKLDIYYDWSMIQAAQPEWYEGLLEDMAKVKDLDVKHHGGVDHATLHAALKRANVWAYSHFDNTTVETFCISAVKATAAGATVLSTPFGALPEVAPCGVLLPDLESYKEALVGFLEVPMSTEERAELAHQAVDRFAWDSVAKRFSAVWSMRFAEEAAARRLGPQAAPPTEEKRDGPVEFEVPAQAPV